MSINFAKSNYTLEMDKKFREMRICTDQGFCYKKEDFDWDKGDIDTVIYIPELAFENIPLEIDDIYTKGDFINLANEKAERLFNEVDWQSPSTLYDEWEMYEDEEI